MDYLNLISQFAGILGFGLSLLAVYRLRNLQKLVADQSISKVVFGLFHEIMLFPPGKKILTKTSIKQVDQLISYLDRFYISCLPWKHKKSKTLIAKIKQELAGDKHTEVIKRDIGMLRDQLLSVEHF